MATYRLRTPIKENEVKGVKVEDSLYITGTIITARDEAHVRVLEYLEQGKPIPFEFREMVVYHCGPLVKKVGRGWEVLAAGPTTSMRMEALEAKFIEKVRPRVIVGKGGMGKNTVKAMKKYNVVYCENTGGVAILPTKAIERVQGVAWLDLGTLEALWSLRVKDFGPLLVTIDCAGNNLRDKLIRKIEARKTEVLGL